MNNNLSERNSQRNRNEDFDELRLHFTESPYNKKRINSGNEELSIEIHRESVNSHQNENSGVVEQNLFSHQWNPVNSFQAQLNKFEDVPQPTLYNLNSESPKRIKRESTFHEKIFQAKRSLCLSREEGEISLNSKPRGFNYLKPIVSKAIFKLRSQTKFRKYDNLKGQFYQSLNDYSYFYQNLSVIQVSKKIILSFIIIWVERIENAILALTRLFFTIIFFWKFERFEVFNPFFPKMMWWDCFQLFLSFLSFAYVPLNISTEYTLPYFFTLLLFVGLAFDILLMINTGFLNLGEFIIDRRLVLRNYLKTGFSTDLLALVPLICLIFNDSDNLTPLKYLIFFQVFKIYRKAAKIQEYMQLKSRHRVMLDLFKLLLFCLLICHFSSCFWLLIGKNSSIGTKPNWLSEMKIMNEPWTTQYIYSYYWSVVTIMTVGYGDITPQNTSEIAFTIIIILFGGAIFLYNINYLGILLLEMSKEKEKLKNSLYVINKFMERKKIDYDLQLKVRHNIKNIISEEEIIDKEKETALIEKLPPNLKEELLLEANGFILRKMPVLYRNFSKSSLKKLVCLMKELRFSPGDIICKEADNSNDSLYCVSKGIVLLYQGINDENVRISELKVPSFIHNQGRRHFWS